ncbi:MAG: S-layer protein [Candidatus Altiarchaeota archaeon]|nr:S-layer protein [Candidatus Altiarchaeota archaeon]
MYLGAPTTGTVSTVGVTYTYSGLNAEVAVLDSEADTSGNTPLVIVGGPYANALAASLIGSDDATVKDFFGYDATANTGKGVVKLYDASATPWNVEAMVVAGWEAKDTRAAAYMLGQYMTGAKTLSNLDGLSEKKISATSATSYTEE